MRHINCIIIQILDDSLELLSRNNVQKILLVNNYNFLSNHWSVVNMYKNILENEYVGIKKFYLLREIRTKMLGIIDEKDRDAKNKDHIFVRNYIYDAFLTLHTVQIPQNWYHLSFH